jgi:hypothetical protein
MNPKNPPDQILDRPPANTYWVIPGGLLAGEYPLGPDDEDTRADSWPKVPQTREQADYIRRWPKLRNLSA